MNRDNVINLADVKARRKRQSVMQIPDETVEAIANHSPMLLDNFHVELASAQFDYRQEVNEARVIDDVIVHYNVPQRIFYVVDVDQDTTYEVPLGLLLDLYELTNINVNLPLVYEFENDDEFEVRYLHTDIKAVSELLSMKESYIEDLVKELGVNKAGVSNYLVRQLRHFKNEAIENLTLHFAWSFASELAHSKLNGMHSFFIDDEDNYEAIQSRFRNMDIEEVYEIVCDRLNTDAIFDTFHDFLYATENWVRENKQKVEYSWKYGYANLLLDKYNMNEFLDDQNIARS